MVDENITLKDNVKELMQSCDKEMITEMQRMDKTIEDLQLGLRSLKTEPWLQKFVANCKEWFEMFEVRADQPENNLGKSPLGANCLSEIIYSKKKNKSWKNVERMWKECGRM